MLLIDGHNLIGRSGSLSLEEEARSREELLRRIAARKGAGGEAVVVVFDGINPERKLDGTFAGGVKVFYAPAHRTADDEILRRVDATNPKTVTVVTSDGELAARVRGRGAKTLGSEEFWRKLSTPRSPTPKDAPKPAPTTEDADHWMEVFGKGKKGR